MRGSKIVIEGSPKGKFLGGIAGDTSKPGTMMEIKLGVAPVRGNAFTWVAYGSQGGVSTADPRMVAILTEDMLQGFPDTTAAVVGQGIFLYVPYPGEFMNILVTGEPGTGSANFVKIGERLVAAAGTGKFVVESTSSVSAQFTCLEYAGEPADVDTLTYAIRN